MPIDFRAFAPGVLLAVACCAADAARQPRTDPFEAAVRRLSDAVRPHRDDRHIDLLASLRSLEDPTLAPFFSRLTSSGDPVIQLNGLLGLAELSPERRIDPWLVSRLPSEAAKLQAINLAIGLELIDAELMRALIQQEELEDAVRVAILAELMSLGEPIDRETLAPLAKSENQKVRTVAAMLIAQAINDRAPFDEILRELDALAADERRYACLWLANDAGQYRLTVLLPWLEEIAKGPGQPDDEVAVVAIESALLIDPDRGVELWRAHLARDDSHARRAALGLLLLDAAREVDIPREAFDEIRDGQELTERIADAGAALAGDRAHAAEALIALLSLDHWRSAADAAASAKALPPEQAALVYEAIVRRAMEPSLDPSVRAPRQELAVLAVPLLFETAPQRIEALLAEIPDDSREQEILLIGLLGSDGGRAGELARGVRRLGFGAADCLALLLLAKHSAAGELSQPDMNGLGMLASGGGRLSAGMAAEAAWLYIRHSGKVELAISRLFATAEQQ